MRVTNHNTAWKGTTAWMEDAACKNVPRDVFFPTVGDIAIRDTVPKAAGDICAVCPVKAECLDFALRNRSLDGVWGGTSEEDRRKIRRQRRRSVPAQPRHHHH
jgi:WhiB family transcriptional regulator, redox-sensing transcriptional regulator